MSQVVLLVDDEPEVLAGIKIALRKERFKILTAESGFQALEILDENPVDVIVCDEKMPRMSGSALLARVRKEYPNIIRIMLTGHATVSSAMNAIYDGWVYQYLHKPINPADLSSTVYNALLMRSLKMEDESPHLTMEPDAQQKLLEQLSEPEYKQTVRDPRSSDENRPISVSEAVSWLQGELEAAKSCESIGDVVKIVQRSLDTLLK